MITVNKLAGQMAIKLAIEDAIKQATAAADEGQDRVILRFSCPNYIDGNQVMDALNKEGVYCVERGYSSNENYTGGYDFEVTCTIGYNTLNLS